MVSSPDCKTRLTVPNIITLARILLTPLFIIFLIQKHYHLALWIFVLAGLSDMVDGLIARRWQQRSPLGTFLDPLADKLLMCSSFVTLAIYHHIPPWLAVIVISRDVVLVLGVTLFKLVNFPVVVHPSVAGKLSTAIQVITVFLVLVVTAWNLSPNFLPVLFWLTGILTTISGIHYILQALWHGTHAQNGRER
jgi:cardiolipin synthase|uniref:CDP-diacylglycerol--glycerol-3-phosphate 3-phosphatidyltransferase n=1 Tax=Desulfobacca acetoxidans TaxID=60893 RepID=A0A7V6A6J9_9BACT